MSTSTQNTAVTLEQLVAMFGQEQGQIMFDQMNESSGGSSIPFPFLKVVSDSDLGIGKFGEFVFGTKFAKDADANGDRPVEDAGTNVGSEFELFIVNVSYRFQRWNDTTKRTERSNIFTGMDGFKNAIDYNGKPISADKNVRKEQGWKTVKIVAGLVNAGGTWTPVIYELKGKMYYTFGELLDKAPGKGTLTGICTISTKTEKQGSTKYTVLNLDKSGFRPLKPFVDAFYTENADAISSVTKEMAQYQESESYADKRGGTVAQDAGSQDAAVVNNDDTNW